MESIPLLYKIVFVVVINTIVVSVVAYLLCRMKVKKEVKSMVSLTKSEETDKPETSKLQKGETEVPRQYQKPVSTPDDKKLTVEKQVKDQKKQKFLRYTPLGYINIEEDKNKKKSKWR